MTIYEMQSLGLPLLTVFAKLYNGCMDRVEKLGLLM